MRIELSELSQGLDVEKNYVEEINSLNISLEKLSLFIGKYCNYVNYDYSRLAGRLYIYFKIYFSPRTTDEYIEEAGKFLSVKTKRFLSKNKSRIDEILARDEFINYKNYDYFSSHTIVAYLLRTQSCKSICETPILMFLRQAIELYANSYTTPVSDIDYSKVDYEDIDLIAKIETKIKVLDDDEEFSKVIQCYDDLINQRYVHASPVMFNAGTVKPQMSSCFLAEAGDSLESLMELGVKIAKITKNNGATGLNMSNIRHSDIANSGESKGSTPFGQIWDQTLTTINQGGKRNGSGTFFMRMCHIDIMEHIGMKDYTVDVHNKYKTAMVCVLTNGLFYQRLKTSKKGVNDWTLFCPKKAILKTNIYFNGKTDNSVFIMANNKKIFNAEILPATHEIRLFDCYDFLFDFWYPIFEMEIENQENEIKDLVKEKEECEKEHFMTHEKKYRNILARLNKATAAFFVNKKVCTIDMIDKIQDSQMKSSNPFMVNEDSINYMNNTKRTDKNIVTSNLCLEITLPCDVKDVSSCNLGSYNLKYPVMGKIQKGEKCTPELLRRVYDFETLGKGIRSLVRNINKIIDNNYYLGIEFKRPNLENRPLGIGVSGFGNCLYQLDISYDSDYATLLNKMIFACIYYNALSESCKLSEEDGEYYNFRKGSHMRYNPEKKEFIQEKGCPLANGYMQFDMWNDHFSYKKDIGRISEEEFKACYTEPIPVNYFLDSQDNETWGTLKEKIMVHGLRNSMLIALMPTATSAQILNNTEATELHTSNLYTRKTNNGEFVVVNVEMMEDFKKERLWNKDLFEHIKLNDGSLSNLDKYLLSEDKIHLMGENEVIDFIKHMKGKYPTMHETKMKKMCEMVKDRGIYICHSESHNVFSGNCTKEKLVKYHIISEMYSLKTSMYYLHQNDLTLRTSLTIDSSKGKKIYTEEEKKMCSLKNKADCLACQ
jgi:ribonucleotide reductase alpha subunit